MPLDSTGLRWETLWLSMCSGVIFHIYVYISPNFYNWKNVKYTSGGNYTRALKMFSFADNLSLYSKVCVNYCLAGVCHKKQNIMTPLKENVS